MKRLASNEYALLKLNRDVDTSDFIPLSGLTHLLKEDELKLAIYGYPASQYKFVNDKWSVGQFGLVQQKTVVKINENEGSF